MKKRRYVVGTTLLCLFASLFAPLVPASAESEAISPGLAVALQEAAPDEGLSVVVTFESTVDLDSIAGRSKSTRRLNTSRALRDDYAQQVGPHERFLRTRQARRVVPLWIINGMAVTASADTIEELARRAGVASIRLDSTIEGPETTPGLTDEAEWNLEAIEYNSSRGPSSSFGKMFPRVVAPGVDIHTADLTFGGLFPNSYTTVAGTSFSAPHVAGAMALLLGAFPETTVTELELALEKTAVDLGAPGPDNEYGYGLIDVEAAFRRLRHFSGVSRERFLLYR